MPNDDMMFHLGIRQFRMNELENRMAAQTRVRYLRDDPIAASKSVRYQSALVRLGQYADNAGTAQGELRHAEGYLTEALHLLQRVRDLTVQGANGTYTRGDMGAMAVEVDQLLEQLVLTANAQDTAGRFIFSGFDARTEPFRVAAGYLPDAAGTVTTAVEYLGDGGQNLVQIADNGYVPMSVPGNHAFWAEHQQIYASVDAADYRLAEDARIRIDGTEIQLRAGDTALAVVARINEAGAGVKASLDPVTRAFVLQTTHPHQIRLEDLGEGTVLQDLGVLSRVGPPRSYADSARVFGGSAFDMVLRVRNALYGGDHETVGGEGLGGMDLAIESLTTALARVGSYDERLGAASERLAYEIPEITAANSREVDLDLAEAITNLKMLEYTHQAALAAAGRVLRPLLLDFLR
jgi:flagellar hook-associated protein 3 FlgL